MLIEKHPEFDTFNKCRNEAEKYADRDAFKNGSPAQRGIALDKGWLPLFFPLLMQDEKAIYRCHEAAARSAAKHCLDYDHFRLSEPVHCYVSEKLGILQQLFPTSIIPEPVEVEKIEAIEPQATEAGAAKSMFEAWSIERIVKAARRCNSLSELRRTCFAAYAVADALGILDEVAAVVGMRSKTTRLDTMRGPNWVYYIRVFNPGGPPAFKIGVTSRRDPIAGRWLRLEDREKVSFIDGLRTTIGLAAYAFQDAIVRRFQADLYDGPKLLTSGWTETFDRDVLRSDLYANPLNRFIADNLRSSVEGLQTIDLNEETDK